MRSTGRLLRCCAVLVAVLAPSLNNRVLGGSGVPVADNFAGYLTDVSGAASSITGIANNDFIVGEFTYPGATTTSNGNYNMSGNAQVDLSFYIYSSPSKYVASDPAENSIFGDSYTLQGPSGKANYFNLAVSFKPSTYSSGTTLTITGDSTYKFGLGQTFEKGNGPAFTLTLYNPTNGFDGVANKYSATNLPLPDQTTITDNFAASTSAPAHLAWDPWGQSFNSNIYWIWQQGSPPPNFMVPEPSSLVLVVMAIAVGAGGVCVSRRKHLRSISR